MPQSVETTEIEFIASDGAALIGDLRVPPAPVGAAIVCHPHPQHGGNRFNNVVEALFAALPNVGIATLRFDFRADFDDAKGELLDAEAAVHALSGAVAGVPVFATGYSFGAVIALALDDPRIVAKVLVAPPLAKLDAAPGMRSPTLVLTPAHDQFSPPQQSEPIAGTWPETIHDVIESADHFLIGHASEAAICAAAFLSRFCSEVQPPSS